MLSCEVYITQYILFISNSTNNTNTKMTSQQDNHAFEICFKLFSCHSYTLLCTLKRFKTYIFIKLNIKNID